LIAYKLISGSLYKVLNLNRARMQGVELNFNLYCKHYYTASFGYTYLDARDVSKDAGQSDVGYSKGNRDLPYKIRHSFNFNSDAFYGNFAWNVNGRYNGAVKEVSIYPGSEPDAFFVINSKLSYKIVQGKMIYIAVNNITNKQYEEIERYRMPGRSYTLGTIFEF
jgi:iron complex outermembrane receptor protein